MAQTEKLQQAMLMASLAPLSACGPLREPVLRGVIISPAYVVLALVVALTLMIGFYLIIHRRITASKRSEALYRSAFEGGATANIIGDQRGYITQVNSRALSLFHYSREELLGQLGKILIAPEYQLDDDDDMLDYFRLIEHSGREITAVRKGGERFRAFLSVSIQSTDGGEIFVASLTDLSDLKQLEWKLQNARKMEALGTLTGGIAHDFNNILSIISGHAELLHEAAGDDGFLGSSLSEILRATDRGASLTHRLLAFSRDSYGQKQTAALGELLEEDRQLLQRAMSTGSDLEIALDTDLWPAYLDPDDFEDAILNMVINADYAMPEGGKVRIGASNTRLDDAAAAQWELPAGDYITLTIADNGSGIDEETRDRIFDPFFSTKGSEGTGLGLNQVYGFVQRSKGAVSVASEVGLGTTFTLLLPRYRKNATAPPSKADNTAVSFRHGDGQRVLVVDDEPEIAALVERVLSSQGYRVTKVATAVEAAQRLADTPFNLLVSDIDMPEIDGFELSKQALESQVDIRILLISGYDLGSLELQARGVQDCHLLTKPFRRHHLLGAVEEVLNA